MIDVPIAVRDALKDGGYKKNYRFVVGDVAEENVWEKVTDFVVDTPFTIAANDDYRIYCDVDAHFVYELYGTPHDVVSMAADDAGGYYVSLGALEIGDVVEITESYYSLVLQRESDETQEVFHPDYEIENDRLVKESVKIDERMCSDDMLKFGLCEGSSLEFQAFNIPNLTGKRLRAYVDVDYPVITYDYDETTNKTTKIEDIQSFSIPMGWYDVSESSRQASTGIRKISAYNKLKSEYLDEQANALIIQEFGTQTVRILDIIMFLLRRYGIRKLDTVRVWANAHYLDNKSTPKRCFSPYKYNNTLPPAPSLAGQAAGAFNKYAFYENYGFNCVDKNIYIEGHAFMDRYVMSKLTDTTTPIQVHVDSSIPLIDNTIATYIQNHLAILETQCNKDAATLWNEIQRMKSVNPESWLTLDNYFFYVKITFNNNTTRIYGNHILNADGTFEQLGRTTFTDLRYIDVVTPNFLRYGWSFEGNYLKQHTSDATAGRDAGITNNVWLWGDVRDIDWFHEPPLLPDGTKIYGISDGISVHVLTGGYSAAELIEVKPDELANVTLRDLQTAVFETQCQFGKLDRLNNYFTGIELNNGRLYPTDTLYPDDALYPMSTSESGFRAMYSKLWADEGNIRKWRNLVITYKGFIENEDTQEHEEAEKVYTTVIDSNGTDDYEVKNNWLFKNLKWKDEDTKTWAETAGLEKIEDYATAMVNKMQSVSWFPFEMWCAGLPYVETGDEVEIVVGEHAYTSYVLRRTIKGIQNLQDEMINGTLDIF